MLVQEVAREGVVYIRSDESIIEAATKMRRFHVGNLVVVDEWEPQPVPVGILTDRDIVVGLVAQDVEHIEHLTVADVLTSTDVVTAEEGEDLAAVIQRMKDHAIRRMPVVDERGVLSGIVTLDDLVGVLARQLTDLVAVVHQQAKKESRERP